MVHPEGLEPPTPGFEVQHSIQLSYGCKRYINNYNIKKNKLLEFVKLLFIYNTSIGQGLFLKYLSNFR